jgi:molybdate-binding protein/DNA-binding XRE family transcriptional regulator
MSADASRSIGCRAMIISYIDTIMAMIDRCNRLPHFRRQQGWSQAELASRARVSRAAISAIEVQRLVPSVAAALAIAAALRCTVEELFGSGPPVTAAPTFAWPPNRLPCRFWQAEVSGRCLRYPCEATATGVMAHDGVMPTEAAERRSRNEPTPTLVLAGCDPAAGLLAAELARTAGVRLLALPRSSGQALALLGQGLVHVAGVHLATPGQPDGNARAVQTRLGGGYRLLRLARWQEGLALSPLRRPSSVSAVVRSNLRWIGREPGAGARQCLDELLPARRRPRRQARDHRGVAEAIRAGWADVGVCQRLACEESGLMFLPVREEDYDLCYAARAEADPRLRAMLQVLRSSVYRRLLGELPGYDTHATGEVAHLN